MEVPTKGVHKVLGATPSYPPQFKREAVRLVQSSPERTIPRIAKELGISDNSLRNWVKQTEIDGGKRREGLTSEKREEPRGLRKKVKVLRQERGISKKPLPFSSGRTGYKVRLFGLIDAEKANYPISLLSRASKVSRSGY